MLAGVLDVGVLVSYAKPDGLLLAKPVERKEPKSDFLVRLERHQALAAKPKPVDPAFDDDSLPGLLRRMAQ